MSRAALLQEIKKESSKERQVAIVCLAHRVPGKNYVLPEIVLGGDQPHQQGHPGPVKRLASPYRGVSFHSCTQRWRSRIKHGSKSEHLGYYISDVEAAKAYNDAASKIHGSGAQLNDGVDVVLADENLETTTVSTVRVPYDGVTVYEDSTHKSRAMFETRFPERPATERVNSDTRDAPYEDFSEIVPMPASLNPLMRSPELPSCVSHDPLIKAENPTKDDDEVEYNFSEVDDLFLQLWLAEDEPSADVLPLDFSLDNFEPTCGMKRSADFADMHEAKRLQIC
eukprot:CAMPEP_0184510758 /NCGR_PEP_ID=MMETSP0198_2-20121128/1987_1 /TAXON_ID=1112570 /ORGANISM="Thraustochytrium sp., Strain LLF1b" /LENGTH=281 /DNA_ID=CAMNT_0026900675 /DNA_START=264 /DNA_END=1109 /DNA_ORIENTATION=-